MPTYTITLPVAAAAADPGTPPSTALRARLMHAVDQGLLPALWPPGTATAVVRLRLPPALAGSLQRRADAVGLPLVRLCARLLWAEQQSRYPTNDPPAPARSARPPARPIAAPVGIDAAFRGRPEQSTYYQGVREALGPDTLVIAEGGTGLGKGRVMAALAIEHRADGVVVAAPSVAVLGQNAEEFNRLAGPGQAVCYLGANAFVSEARLLSRLDAPESDGDEERAEIARVREWLASGAGCCSPETRALHDAAPMRWLYEDLEAIAPMIAEADVRLRARRDESEEDAGADAYRAMRAAVRADARVIFATHAALVWHHRLQQTLLGSHALLLLDEAHAFAAQAEQTFSSSIALRRLDAALRDPERFSVRAAARAARQAATRLREIVKDATARRHVLAGGARRFDPRDASHAAVLALLRDIAAALQPLRDMLAAEDLPSEVRDALEICNGGLRNDERVLVEFSPVHAYPSLTMGPRSLRRWFEALWEATPRVVLVSATLMLPRTSGGESSSYAQATLHLPGERVRVLVPVHPHWLFAVPLHTPDAAALRALTPPMESAFPGDAAAFESATASWHDAVADTLVEVQRTALGGTLCLCTGYDSIDALAARLQPVLGADLVVQRRAGFRHARQAFLARSRLRGRPLWLATGPAWTGTDMNAARLIDPGIDAARDTLLTDLVIPRIPFGTESSSVHKYRRSWMATAERDRAAFQLRQGLGRLLRREGLPQRRLWVLDGRIWGPPRHAFLVAPIRLLLERYPRRVPVGLRS
jgi:ATP-dependent DNA helicase DinG